jgi:hypothetical protein
MAGSASEAAAQLSEARARVQVARARMRDGRCRNPGLPMPRCVVRMRLAASLATDHACSRRTAAASASDSASAL